MIRLRVAPIIQQNCIEPALYALLLALVYLKDMVIPLPNPGEQGFINNRTPESGLTLQHAAGFPWSSRAWPGFMIENKNQGTLEGRAAGRGAILPVSLCAENMPWGTFWPPLEWPHSSDGQSSLFWQLSHYLQWHQKHDGFYGQLPGPGSYSRCFWSAQVERVLPVACNARVSRPFLQSWGDLCSPQVVFTWLYLGEPFTCAKWHSDKWWSMELCAESWSWRSRGSETNPVNLGVFVLNL